MEADQWESFFEGLHPSVADQGFEPKQGGVEGGARRTGFWFWF